MSELDHRGGCSCGWQGAWRLTETEAHADMHEHYRQTKCRLTVFHFREVDLSDVDDDLMPFERNQTKENQ